MAEKLLIKELKKGKEAAYRQIVTDYGNKLMKTCFLMLGSMEEAEDVVQETFIKVFEKIESFRENSGLYTWIYKIAINLSRDKLRKKKDVVILDDEIIGSEDVEAYVENNIDKETLKQELFKLHPIYMEVMILFYFDEFSIKEISALLDEKEGTIKSRLSRGRNILKDNLLKGGRLNG